MGVCKRVSSLLAPLPICVCPVFLRLVSLSTVLRPGLTGSHPLITPAVLMTVCVQKGKDERERPAVARQDPVPLEALFPVPAISLVPA